MKTLLLFFATIFFSLNYLSAQEVDKPFKAATENEIIPEAPSENHTWVKGHWQYDAGKYYWIDGAYVETLANHVWIDGKWVQNHVTEKWTFQDGFWNLEAENIVYKGVTYYPGVLSKTSIVEILDPMTMGMNIIE